MFHFNVKLNWALFDQTNVGCTIKLRSLRIVFPTNKQPSVHLVPDDTVMIFYPSILLIKFYTVRNLRYNVGTASFYLLYQHLFKWYLQWGYSINLKNRSKFNSLQIILTKLVMQFDFNLITENIQKKYTVLYLILLMILRWRRTTWTFT